jgi:hypothetical protein
MKRLWMLAILMLVLAGCGGSAAPSGGQCNKGLCVKIDVAEPIRWEEPIGVTVTVTAEKDISNLQISLTSYPPVSIEDQGKWVEEGMRTNVNVTANRPLVIVRKVRLPTEGTFELIAGVYTPNLPYVSDSVRIYLTREGGVVNPTPAVFSGTPALVPTMPPEWLLTPFSTATPWPTPIPTPTMPLVRTPTPAEATPPFISPLPTPTPAAYP